MVDYHIRAHSECSAADPSDTPPKKVLQVTWRPGDTCSHVSFEEVSFRHLHKSLIEQSKDFDKVTIIHPDTKKKRVLKDNGNSVEPFYEE